MAEERLIDDDKDRKYRIRKNENGEEELVIIDTDDDDDEIPEYLVTEEDEKLSKEQLAERNEERRQAVQRKVAGFKEIAVEKMSAGDFESAQYALKQAAEITEYDGELYYLQLKAHSRNMTDFYDLQRCADAADGVREYSGEEQKKELASMSGALEERIKQFEEKCAMFKEKNEQGKAERRETFASAKKRSLILFCATAVPFVALFVLAIVFATMMDADVEGLYMILTIVFSVLAALSFFNALFAYTRFSAASRRVRLNEDDSSTSVGREFVACSEELENLKKIYNSFSNDIS